MKLCLSRYRFHIPKLERLDHINLHIRISCHHKKEKCHHRKSLWHNYMILLPYIFKNIEYLCRKCSQCSHKIFWIKIFTVFLSGSNVQSGSI